MRTAWARWLGLRGSGGAVDAVSPGALSVFVRNWIARRHLYLRFGRVPRDSDLEPLAALCERCPAWVEAQTLPADLLFLHDMIRCTRPRRVIEIGVASGLSTSVILHSLVADGAPLLIEGPDAREAVQSVDILETVPWNKSIAIGAAIGELVPELRHGVRIHTGRTALDLVALLPAGWGEFAFVDANHAHPWPLIDVVHLAPVMRPGSWIVLHDIGLAERAVEEMHRLRIESVDFRVRGAQYLFEFWPYEKIRSVGDCWNVGAIRLPADGPLNPSLLAGLAAIPWETGPTEAGFRALFDRVGRVPVTLGANMHRRDLVLPTGRG